MPNRKLNGISVLVVDDAADNLTWMRMILELDGATVFSATSASEALVVLETVVADILITELRLPDLDGFELLRAIREGRLNENADVPAVAMSVYTIDFSRAQDAGFAAFEVKPILAQTIVDAVARIVVK